MRRPEAPAPTTEDRSTEAAPCYRSCEVLGPARAPRGRSGQRALSLLKLAPLAAIFDSAASALAPCWREAPAKHWIRWFHYQSTFPGAIA